MLLSAAVFYTVWGLITTQLGNVTETMTLQNGSTTQARRCCCLFCMPCYSRLHLMRRTWHQMHIFWGMPSAQDPAAHAQVDTYVEQHFGFTYSFRGWLVLIILGFVAVFRVGAILAVTKLSYVKR